MYRLFISHSSLNFRAAESLSQWLSQQGWPDHFLDQQPQRGLVAGMEWSSKLKESLGRCEAVICLLSKEWCDSPWCVQEATIAEWAGVPVVPAFIDAVARHHPNCKAILARWQAVDLLSSDGYTRLKAGLEHLGMRATSFGWSADRCPYPGLRPFEDQDAAVYFGRETLLGQALSQLNALLKNPAARPLWVMVGASGTGKSSFMRAGVLRRLERTCRPCSILPVLRPSLGLRSALADALLAQPAISKQGVSRRELRELVGSAEGTARVLGFLDPDHTVVVPIDQCEEAFDTEAARAELDWMWRFFGDCLKRHVPRVLVMVTIRSDRFHVLQAAAGAAAVELQTLSIGPMQSTEFRSVIEGPVARARMEGASLSLDPLLVDRLAADARGPNALPLLAHALRHLVDEFGSRGQLSVSLYEKIGGMSGAILDSVRRVLAEPHVPPVIPAAAEAQLHTLKATFVPWLASPGVEAGSYRRRVASVDEFPPEATPFIERMLRERLLVLDGAQSRIEVAHEALFDAWPDLRAWLDADRVVLVRVDEVILAASQWRAEGRRPEDLRHFGARVSDLRAARLRPDLRKIIAGTCRDYLVACRIEERRRRNIARNQATDLVATIAAAQSTLDGSRAMAAVKHRVVQAPLTDRMRVALASMSRINVPLAVRSFSWEPAENVLPERSARKLASSLFMDDGPSCCANAAWDGRLLVGMSDGQLMWIERDGQVQIRTRAHPRWVTALACNGPQGVVCSGGDDGVARLFDSRSLALLGEHPMSAEVTCTWVYADSSVAIAGDVEGQLLWVDIASGRTAVVEAGSCVRQLAANASGSAVAALCRDDKGQRLVILDTSTGHALANVQLEHAPLATCMDRNDDWFRVSFAHGSCRVSVQGQTTEVSDEMAGASVLRCCRQTGWIVGCASGTVLAVHPKHRATAVALKGDPNGCVVELMGTVALVRTRRELWTIDLSSGVHDLSTASDWTHVCIDGEDGAIAVSAITPDAQEIVWATRFQRLGRSSTQPRCLARPVAYSRQKVRYMLAHRSRSLIGCDDGTIWDGNILLPGHSKRDRYVRGMALSPNQDRLAAVYDSGTVRLWSAEAPMTLQTEIQLKLRSARGVLWSPDGKLIAVNDWTGQAALLDSRDLKTLTTAALKRRIAGEAFSRDSKHMTLIDEGGKSWILAIDGILKPARSLKTGTVHATMRVPATGRMLIVCSDDDSVRWIHADDAAAAQTLLTGVPYPSSVDVSQDGRYLVVVDREGKLHCMDLSATPPIRIDLAGRWHRNSAARFLTSDNRLALVDYERRHITVHEFRPDCPELQHYDLGPGARIKIDEITVDPDGHMLVASEHPNWVLSIPVSDDAIVKGICALSGRAPEPEDRRRFALLSPRH
jgi:WD40 repeat protein